MKPWKKKTEEKIHNYMNEIIRIACANEIVPTWNNLIKKYNMANCHGWKIHKAMMELGYIDISNNRLSFKANNWVFLQDGITVYKRAKELEQTLRTYQLDLTPVISDEEQEIENLKAKLSQLQKEIEERQAAFEKKNRLSSLGKEILEMFNLSADELKEIVSIL